MSSTLLKLKYRGHFKFEHFWWIVYVQETFSCLDHLHVYRTICGIVDNLQFSLRVCINLFVLFILAKSMSFFYR